MKSLITVLACIALCSLSLKDAHAQFGRVKVQMQSGEFRPIMELPWFQLQLNVHESQWKGYANTADWVVTSAPLHCPFGSGFRLQWKGRLTDADQQLAVSRCSDAQSKKYESAERSAGVDCACKPVLRTVTQGRLPWSEALWESFDDELLLADELRLALILKEQAGSLADRSGGGQTPVMLVLGSQRSGLFDLHGQSLCSARQATSVSGKSSMELIQALLERFGARLQLSCLGHRQADVDFSAVSFSVLRGRMTGTARLEFEDGERYELVFP